MGEALGGPDAIQVVVGAGGVRVRGAEGHEKNGGLYGCFWGLGDNGGEQRGRRAKYW